MKRREFFKKLGLGAGVALCAPVVVTALVPEGPQCSPGWIEQIKDNPIIYGTAGEHVSGAQYFKDMWDNSLAVKPRRIGSSWLYYMPDHENHYLKSR